jgi:hypothetical protein
LEFGFESFKEETPMNVKLLREVKRHILEEPRRLNMNSYGYLVDGPDAPACKTVGCIAGWSGLLSQGHLTAETGSSFMDPEVAREALKLTENQADRLFTEPWVALGGEKRGHCWPIKFAKRFEAATSEIQKAKVTAARIEHFIKTKGRE